MGWLQSNILEDEGAQTKPFSVREEMKEQREVASLEPSIKEVKGGWVG